MGRIAADAAMKRIHLADMTRCGGWSVRSR
jgi:hypothetical protein